jgi:hypothetical protein
MLQIFLTLVLTCFVAINTICGDDMNCARCKVFNLWYFMVFIVAYLSVGTYLIDPFRKFRHGSCFGPGYGCVRGSRSCGTDGHANSFCTNYCWHCIKENKILSVTKKYIEDVSIGMKALFIISCTLFFYTVNSY